MNKFEEVIEIIDLGKNGFIIQTVNTNDYKYTLRLYNSQLGLDWETPMNMSSTVFKTATSHTSDYIYITNQTLQIDLKEKTQKRLEISQLPPGRVFRGFFMDKQFWYSLYYVKYNDTYLCRRVEHQTGKLKDISFQLPKGPQYVYSTDWYYAGNDINNFYLYNKTAGFQNLSHRQNNTLEYEIVAIDTLMTIKNRFSIEIRLDSLFVCPSLNFKRDHEMPSPAYDFELKTIGIKDLWIPKPEAYSSVFYNPASNSFFIYGLWGTDPFFETNNKSKAKGFFIYNYDSDGNLKYKVIEKLPNDTSIFAGFDISTLFSVTNDGKQLLQIYHDRIISKVKVRGTVYSFLYANDKLFNRYINHVQSARKKNTAPLSYDFVIENLQHFDFILTSSSFTGPVKFYNTLSPAQQVRNIYRNFNYGNTNILIEEIPKSRTINMFLFNK